MINNPSKWIFGTARKLPAGAIPLSDDETGTLLVCLFPVQEGRWRRWNTRSATWELLPDSTQQGLMQDYERFICAKVTGSALRCSEDLFARAINRPVALVQGWKSGAIPLSMEDAYHLLRLVQ